MIKKFENYISDNQYDEIDPYGEEDWDKVDSTIDDYKELISSIPGWQIRLPDDDAPYFNFSTNWKLKADNFKIILMENGTINMIRYGDLGEVISNQTLNNIEDFKEDFYNLIHKGI